MLTINKKLNHKSIWIDSMIGMTWGFIASLVVGTVVGLLGINQHNAFSTLVGQVKAVMSYITGFAIGVGIGVKTKMKPLQILAMAIGCWLVAESTLVPKYIYANHSIVWDDVKLGIHHGIFKDAKTDSGWLAFSPGDVFGAWIMGVILIYLFSTVQWETKLDIILVPLLGAILGLISSMWLTYLTTTILVLAEYVIDHTANKAHWAAILLAPVIGALMGLALSLPTSSTAIALAIKLQGDAATAAMAGTAAQMISFGVMTYLATRKLAPSLAVGFGTSMLHLKNFSRKPLILLLPTIISAFVALIAVSALPLEFPLTSVKGGQPTSGMGSCALYGQIFTLQDNGWRNWAAWLNVIFIQLLMPALLGLAGGWLFFKKGWIKKENMEI